SRGARDYRSSHARSADDALPAVHDHAAVAAQASALRSDARAALDLRKPGGRATLDRRRDDVGARRSFRHRAAGAELRSECEAPAIRPARDPEAGAVLARRPAMAPLTFCHVERAVATRVCSEAVFIGRCRGGAVKDFNVGEVIGLLKRTLPFLVFRFLI